MTVTLYHNSRCATSRKVKAALEAANVSFAVIEYLKQPLQVEELKVLAQRLGVSAQQLVRKKEPLYKELGLDGADVSSHTLFTAIAEHPRLLERPIVVADSWAAICRPASVIETFISAQH